VGDVDGVGELTDTAGSTAAGEAVLTKVALAGTVTGGVCVAVPELDAESTDGAASFAECGLTSGGAAPPDP
jgi:hypothetical protein